MSRSGYCDDLDDWELIRWRGQVASAIRGRRGQKLLTDMIAALDALPHKVIVMEELQDESGDVCALGAVAQLRGIDVKEIDPEEPQSVAVVLDIAYQLAMEIAYYNDEVGDRSETPQHRWNRMRAWAVAHLRSAESLAKAKE